MSLPREWVEQVFLILVLGNKATTGQSVSPDFYWQNTFATIARDLFCKNTWSQKCDYFPASFTDFAMATSK